METLKNPQWQKMRVVDGKKYKGRELWVKIGPPQKHLASGFNSKTHEIIIGIGREIRGHETNLIIEGGYRMIIDSNHPIEKTELLGEFCDDPGDILYKDWINNYENIQLRK